MSTKIFRSIVIVVGMGLAMLLSLLQFDPASTEDSVFQRLEYILYDSRFNLSLRFQPAFDNKNQIVIVDIDEASLLEQGRMPWGRDKMALLIERLADAGVLVVSFDILFSEPQVNPTDIVQQVVRTQANLELAEQLTQYGSLTDYDQRLADTMLSMDVVLSLLFSQNPDIQVGQLPSPLIIDQSVDISRLTLRTAYGFTSNLPH